MSIHDKIEEWLLQHLPLFSEETIEMDVASIKPKIFPFFPFFLNF